MLMPTRIAPTRSGVAVQSVLLAFGVLGDGVSATAGAGLVPEREVSEGAGCLRSTEQPAVVAANSVSIDRRTTSRSLEVESASEVAIPMPGV
jgi:hypothetical protein